MLGSFSQLPASVQPEGHLVDLPLSAGPVLGTFSQLPAGVQGPSVVAADVSGPRWGRKPHREGCNSARPKVPGVGGAHLFQLPWTS